MQVSQSQIPHEVLNIVKTLEKQGFEAFIVGGCVRDLLLGKKPKDWDITTNASPEQIQAAFENTFYTNEFGTVGVVTAGSGIPPKAVINEGVEDPSRQGGAEADETLKVVEVTPYRLEGKYSDARRPDEIIFAKTLQEDLKRRDFTINALAYNPSANELIDLYEGIKDIKDNLVRAVGNATERFEEDALRILRAIRLSAELDFSIEEETKKAMADNASQLEKISKERVREEFVRILNSKGPMKALVFAQGIGVLKYIAPEIEQGIRIDQNQAHSYDVFEHNMRSLQHAADKGWEFEVRLAALFHDVGKPKVRKWSEEKKDWTFHGHDVVGARMTKKALENLKFSRETIDKVEKLVRWHMFFSDPDQVTLSAVRRIIRNVGPENIKELIELRICDRIGTGRPKEQPFRLRKYQSMIDQALRDPISVAMLKIDGKRLMDATREKPGPRLGWMLHALLEEVLDDPTKNTEDYLEKKSVELASLTDDELKAKGEEGKGRKDEEEEKDIKEIRQKHFVD